MGKGKFWDSRGRVIASVAMLLSVVVGTALAQDDLPAPADAPAAQTAESEPALASEPAAANPEPYSDVVTLPEPAPPPVELAPAPEPAQIPSGLEQIIVTARKVEESIQDVPVAVTALSEETIVQSSSFSSIDLQNLVPNLSIREGAAQNTATIMQLRGQVQNDILGTLDPSVGFYDDGIYVARPHGTNVPLLDLQSVQVLRGPQGTLFGRNTTGGAILMTTNDPNFDGVSGTVSVTGASFGQSQYGGVLNLPLIKDRVALRVAGQTHSTSDGYARDATNNRDIGTIENDLLRAKLLWQPTDNFSTVLTGQYIKIDGLGGPVLAGHALTVTEVVAAGQNPAGCCLATLAAPGPPDYNSFAGGDPYVANFDPGLENVSRGKISSVTLDATWDQTWATLKFIAGIRTNDGIENRVDIDGSPRVIVDTLQFSDNQQISYELQLTGEAFEEKLNWVAGLTDFQEQGSDNGTTLAFGVASVVTRGEIDNTSRGAYVQGHYQILERLGATAGVRYSEDSKKLDLISMTGPTCSIPAEDRDGGMMGECRGIYDKDFDNISYTLGTDFKLFEGGAVFDEGITYASYTTGYRSGGQNLRGASADTLASFDQEDVKQIELGFKSELFERRMRFNAALFSSDYNDIQRSDIVAVNGVPATVVRNAAKAEVRGLEVELSALPLNGLLLGASLGLLDPKYKKFVGPPPNNRDRSQEKFDEVAEMSYSLSATYTSVFDAFGGMEWLNRVDYAWQDDILYLQGGGDYFKDRGFDPEPLATKKAQGLLNARSALSFGWGLEIGIFGRNLTDELRSAALVLAEGPDFVVRTINGPGREVGVDLKYNF